MENSIKKPASAAQARAQSLTARFQASVTAPVEGDRNSLAFLEAQATNLRAAIEAGDRAALHQHFARDFNRFHVDAHPALYTLMAAFPSWRAQRLDYDQAFHPDQNIVVSFASLALFEP